MPGLKDFLNQRVPVSVQGGDEYRRKYGDDLQIVEEIPIGPQYKRNVEFVPGRYGQAPAPVVGPGRTDPPSQESIQRQASDKELLEQYRAYLTINNPELSDKDIDGVTAGLSQDQADRRVYERTNPQERELRATENPFPTRPGVYKPGRITAEELQKIAATMYKGR